MKTTTKKRFVVVPNGYEADIKERKCADDYCLNVRCRIYDYFMVNDREVELGVDGV